MRDHERLGAAFRRRSPERCAGPNRTRQPRPAAPRSGFLPALCLLVAFGLVAGGDSRAAERPEDSRDITNAFQWVLDLWETPVDQAAESPAPTPPTIAIRAAVETVESPTPNPPTIAIRALMEAPAPAPAVLRDPSGDGTDEAVEPIPVEERPIEELTTNIRPMAGPLPTDHAASLFAQRGSFWHPAGTTRPWAESQFAWTASTLCHQPLYFEEISLERYGYAHRWTQPFFSAAHFFGRVPALPYLTLVDCPNEPIYSLGYYRPGSCAPYQVRCLPLRWDASLAEAAAVTGLIFLIP